MHGRRKLNYVLTMPDTKDQSVIIEEMDMRKLLALILMVLITACSGVDALVQQDINKATVTDLSTVGTPTKIDMGTSTRITKRAYDSYNLLDYDTLNPVS